MNGKEGLYEYRAEDIWYHGAGIQHTTKLTASQEVTYIFDETIVLDLEKRLVLQQALHIQMRHRSLCEVLRRDYARDHVLRNRPLQVSPFSTKRVWAFT